MQIGNGLWESASFNNRLQVTQLGLGTSATDTSQWKLDYDFGTTDNNGNIKAQTVTSPVGTYAQSFTYDSLDRLKTANETSGGNQTWTQSFTYDRYGNRIGFSQDIGGQVNNSTPSIDQNTNRFNLGQGYTYDAAGNVITDNQGRSFTFNGDNKQTEVKDSANNIVGTYSYDGDGKRIKKVTNSETTTFVYSGGKLVAEYQLTVSAPTTATTQYLGTDMLGSPRVVSDQTGAVTSRRDFMPFGEDLTRANYGSDTIRQKFTGYEKDTETGLDFAEARYYNNAHGRFTAVDPLLASGKSADPQTFNRYSYTMNNPLNLTDPTGMQAGRRIEAPLSTKGDGLGRLFNEDVEADYSRLAQETILLDESLQKVSSDITVWNNHPMGETVVGTYGGAYNFFAGMVNSLSSVANFIDSPTSTNPRNRPFSYLPYFSATSQIQADAGEVTDKTLTGLSILFGGVGSTATRPSFAGFTTSASREYNLALGIGGDHLASFAKSTNSITYFDVYGKGAPFERAKLFNLMDGAKEINFNLGNAKAGNGFSFSKAPNSYSNWLKAGKPENYGGYTNTEWNLSHEIQQYRNKVNYFVYPPQK